MKRTTHQVVRITRQEIIDAMVEEYPGLMQAKQIGVEMHGGEVIVDWIEEKDAEKEAS